MNFLHKKRLGLKSLLRDESGSMAIAWAISIAAVAGVVAAAIDIAMLQSANKHSQNIADSTALAAAIFVKNNTRIPNNRNEGLLGEYNAKELGYEFRGWVDGGAENVSVNIIYDDVARETTVQVRGNTKPAILQVTGNDLEFYSESTVKYHETDFADPASVVLVLDNSGSMDFDDIPVDQNGNRPENAQPRINGLEASAKELMDMLDHVAGAQDPDGPIPAVLRTGMMAFSGDIIPSRTVNMNWGVISDSKIDALDPGGATNSAPPLETANTWLNINEPPIHKAENPYKTPLKFIIMMTDGQNTVGNEEWVAREGTENWRAWLQVGSHLEFTDEYEIVSAFVTGGSCKVTNGHPFERYVYQRSNGSTFNSFTTQRVECFAQEEVPDFGWVYREQEDRPLEAGDWEEGEFDIESNIATRAQCDDLHAKGVEIYTIAYALAPGEYRTNDWGIINNRVGGANYLFETTAENAAKARGILQYCASDDDNFITADNTAALSTAFERIGTDIIQEIIRISG